MDVPEVHEPRELLPAASPDELLDRLIDRYAEGLLAYVRRFTDSWHDAEDVVQSALLKAHMAAQRGTPLASEKAWIFTLARNEMLNHLERRKTAQRHRGALLRESAAPADPPEASFDALHREIERLPPATKEALALKYFHGLSVDETAEVLKVSPGTIKQLVFRALQTLRTRLGPGPWEDQRP
ncbi:MAG TPA: sigma-70 family RNA polymerase sigma factor [Planctomycetota bacterium]|jgi:RNA polymerase sigma-70 factor (ECF subfamily)|nr:sigma-70 family RNA polymerase sigma factor [Planctomycetota bacterium]